MTWINLLTDSRSIQAIYSKVPDLKSVELFEVSFNRDGSSLQIRLNLDSFPDPPPQKWAANSYNQVQLRLNLSGISHVQLTGWSTTVVGDIEVCKQDQEVVFKFRSEHCRIDCQARFLSVSGISAYCKSTD